MKTNPSDPAHPTVETCSVEGHLTMDCTSQGLTKREHFAAMALQGQLALSVNVTAQVAAESAVMYADALIEALNKEG